ncbi:unnamed protein product [Closterium sp. NIES-53]
MHRHAHCACAKSTTCRRLHLRSPVDHVQPNRRSTLSIYLGDSREPRRSRRPSNLVNQATMSTRSTSTPVSRPHPVGFPWSASPKSTPWIGRPPGSTSQSAGAGGAGANSTGAGGSVQRRLFFYPPPLSSLPPPDLVLRKVLSLPCSTGLPPSLMSPLPHQWQPELQPHSPLPAPSPYAEQTDSCTELREPETHPTSPVCIGRRVPHPRPPPVPGTHIGALRPASIPLRVPLPPPPESSLLAVPDPESYLARAASPAIPRLLATVFTNLSFESTAASALVAVVSTTPLCLAAALPHLVAMLLAPEGDPDAPNIPTPRSYAEAITVPPPGANIVDGMWIFKVKRPPGSSPVFKARYIAQGFGQRQGVVFFQTFSPTPNMTTLRVLLHVTAQRDYELHSLDFSTAFLQGSLHKEIWLRRPLGFTGSFPAGTQWSLRRPVYGLRQAPREWHDTLRTSLAALWFAPSTADPSLFLRTDTSLLPFYVLVYIDDLVFATTESEALALVKSELQKRHTCTDLGELRSYLGLQINRDRARRIVTLTQPHMVYQNL